VQAIDAAQPFDFEFKAKTKHKEQKQLTIGVLGFGNFGQFLAERFVARGHRVLATSRSPYGAVAKKLNVEFFQDPNDFCEEHPDVSV
jgi:arogenate dehydrogenase (NADP+)